MAVSVDIRKRLGSFELKVSFQTEGGVHGLLGASGCGKSLTLLCIAGVMKPDSGRIEVDGRVLFDSGRGIDLPPQKRSVGLLFQNYALFPNMTLEENLRAALHAKGRSRDGEAVGAMLRRFHLQGLENHYPVQLSGGQQQRAALARILLSGPELLMLDEPLSALDSYLRRQTELELMEVFESFGGSILFVSHSRGEVRRLCRSVTVIDSGFGRGSVSVRELFEAPRTLSQAMAAGWENYSRVRKIGEGRLLAEDWGFELAVPDIPADSRYAAVRARSLHLSVEPGLNAIPVKILRTVADINCTAILAAPAEGGEGMAVLRAEAETFPPFEGEKAYLNFPPGSLLFLGS
ncbi:ATP-binding cassette domain-containing protein [bacterium]|nr:ATP-binding cassette domain-containing protein [bacterium]